MGPERADLGPERANLVSERADLGSERGLGGGTYVRTDVRTSGNSPLCPTGHRPFEAAAQKANILMNFQCNDQNILTIRVNM